MANQHPTFRNPTIQEALCEIHFDMPAGTVWNPTWFGDFYRLVEDEFPGLEPVNEPVLQLQWKPGTMEIAPTPSKMRYRHRSRDVLLQLSEKVLTVNVLPAYQGWEQMYKDILYAWDRLSTMIGSPIITRIGLRYINYIPRKEASSQPADWLAPNPYIAAAVLQSRSGLLSRVEATNDANHRMIVTVGERQEQPFPQLVLDIDCITERIDEQILELATTVAHLHDTAWQVFAAFLTPRYRSFLEGGTS